MPPSVEFLNELVDRFAKATEANWKTPGRRGSVIYLSPNECDGVIVSGDLHGNRNHFNKIVKAAGLDRFPKRHLVVQEVIHGISLYDNGGCMSHLLLEDVAALKAKYPERVHFLLSNHELSECVRPPIIKGGFSLNQLYLQGMEYAYGRASMVIHEAMKTFIKSCPLGIRMSNRIFISHTTPSAKALAEKFDWSVYTRTYRDVDLQENGPAHLAVWGRDFALDHAKTFASAVDSDVLIHGHEPCPEGRRLMNDMQIVLDASGAHCWLVLCPIEGKFDAPTLFAKMRAI